MPQKKKRNHWVPQSYLRSFAADPERKRIWTFGKEGGDPELKPIKKVAVKFYLYAPNGPHGRDYSFEDKLASLEELFGEPYWKAVSDGFVDLGSESVRKGLSLLTAVMWLRNPTHLAIMHDIHREIVDFYSQVPELPDAVEINGVVHAIDKESWPGYRDASTDDIKRMWLDEVGAAVRLAKMLMDMRWSVIFAETPAFITTDNPVAPVHPSLRFRGVTNSATSILFPLSPTQLLCLDNRHHEPGNQYYPLKASPGPLNGLLWRYAINAMFSSRHTNEVCAELCADAELGGFQWQPGGWTKAERK